jgi:hypothetical protein
MKIEKVLDLRYEKFSDEQKEGYLNEKDKRDGISDLRCFLYMGFDLVCSAYI